MRYDDQLPNDSEALTMGRSLHRILIVEDHIQSAVSVAHFCKAIADRVEVARDAREAIERLTEDDYDCVLIDCRLPDGDGTDLAQWIRTTPGQRNRETIIIGVSADLRFTRAHCLEAGMNAIVYKPVAPQALVELITSLF